MRYNVEGADASTGADRVIQVEAPDERAAEAMARAQGVLVAGVYPAITKNEAEALDDLAEAAAKENPLPEIDYLSPPPPAPPVLPARRAAVPRYTGLKVGAQILIAFGVLSVVASALLLLAIGILLATDTSMPLGLQAMVGIGGLLYCAYGAAVGGLFWAAGEACLALRDIAQHVLRMPLE